MLSITYFGMLKFIGICHSRTCAIINDKAGLIHHRLEREVLLIGSVNGKLLQHTGWRCINQGGGSMAGRKKRPMAWGMTYQQCQQACIDYALNLGDDQAAAIYRNLPSPSEQEWALYLQEVAEEPSEDLSNPHHIMGRHELRLSKRGIPTVLGQHSALFASQMEEAARKVGFPTEHVLDALELILDIAPHGQPRDKTRDN